MMLTASVTAVPKRASHAHRLFLALGHEEDQQREQVGTKIRAVIQSVSVAVIAVNPSIAFGAEYLRRRQTHEPSSTPRTGPPRPVPETGCSCG